MTPSLPSSGSTGAEARLLVHVVARDEDARQRLSEVIADNPTLCVASSLPPGEGVTPPAGHAPDVVVAYADCIDDCRRVQEFADRHRDAFCVLVVSDIDLAPESSVSPSVNHVAPGRPDAVRETLTTLLDAHARSLEARRTPVPTLHAIDRLRLETLTAREREILALTAEGLSIDATARRLQRTPATVARHRNNIMAKTGLRDRVALTRFAIRVGLASA